MTIAITSSTTPISELESARRALHCGKLEDARELCQSGMRSAETAGDQLALWWYRVLLAHCFSAQGRHGEALHLLESAPSSEIIGASLSVRILNQRAFALTQIGDFFGAKAALARALELADAGDPEILRAEIEMNRCTLFFYLANYDAVETCARTALEIAERNRNPVMEASAAAGIAKAEMYRGRHSSAIPWFERARSLYGQHGLPFYVSRMAGELGCCHLELREHDKAQKYFTEALKASQEAGALPSIHIDLANIGVLHYRRGEYAAALPYFQKALGIARGLGDDISTGKWLHNLSLTYAQMGNPMLAKGCELEAERAAQKVAEPAPKPVRLSTCDCIFPKAYYWAPFQLYAGS